MKTSKPKQNRPHMALLAHTAMCWGLALITCAIITIMPAPAAKAQSGPDMFSRIYSDVIMADNPVIYWRLGEQTGPLAYDQSVNHRDGSYLGNPALGLHGAIAGDENTAVGFNGVNQYMQWNPPTNLAGTFTVEAWVKATRLYPDQTFFTTCNQAATCAFAFDFEFLGTDVLAPKIHFDIGDGMHWLARNRVAYPIFLRTWYYIAAVVTPTGATYYVDGVEAGSASYDGNPLLFDPAHMVRIGSSANSGSGPQKVANVVDEVAVYDYALSSDQIVTHYLTGNPPGE